MISRYGSFHSAFFEISKWQPRNCCAFYFCILPLMNCLLRLFLWWCHSRYFYLCTLVFLVWSYEPLYEKPVVFNQYAMNNLCLHIGNKDESSLMTVMHLEQMKMNLNESIQSSDNSMFHQCEAPSFLNNNTPFLAFTFQNLVSTKL